MGVDEENTFRTLKDQPLLVTSWRCRFAWHRWTKWSEPYAPAKGEASIQHKSCTNCNNYRARRIRIAYD